MIDRLAANLRRELGEPARLKQVKLVAKRALAASRPEQAIIQQAVGQLPWGQITVLLKLHDPQDRNWYASRAASDGWSRKELEHHIATRLRTRIGAAPNNFSAHLEPVDADLARQIVRDSYVFDFLAIDGHTSNGGWRTASSSAYKTPFGSLGARSSTGRSA